MADIGVVGEMDGLSSLMDLDSSWDEDDLIQELRSIPYKPERLSMSSVDMDFRRLVTRTENTSTPFVPRATKCKSLLSSEVLVPCWISNDSGYDAESSVSSSSSSSSNTGAASVSCGFPPIQTESQQLCNQSIIDSSGLSNDDILHEPLSQADSAYDETSSICSQHSQTLSDIISTSPNSSCDAQAMDMVFQALDLNSSGYSSIDSSCYCSQNNLAADSGAVDMSPESESSCESQVSVVEMVCVKLEKALPLFSKLIGDRLIGRKMGLQSVDILSELHIRNMVTSLSVVFNYLSDKDLISVSCVNRMWRASILDDSQARHRKQQYIQQRKIHSSQKENWCVKTSTDRGMVRRREADISPLVELVPADSAYGAITSLTVPSKHEQFINAAAQLTCEESLRKCPQCQHPARVHQVQERAQCSNQACAANFCIKCLGAYHGSKDCSSVISNSSVCPALSKKSRSESKIGSKKSKRNLRRL